MFLYFLYNHNSINLWFLDDLLYNIIHTITVFSLYRRDDEEIVVLRQLFSISTPFCSVYVAREKRPSLSRHLASDGSKVDLGTGYAMPPAAFFFYLKKAIRKERDRRRRREKRRNDKKVCFLTRARASQLFPALFCLRKLLARPHRPANLPAVQLAVSWNEEAKSVS